jgi:hypothetical protein
VLIAVLGLAGCSDSTGPDVDPDLAVITPGDTLFKAVVSSDRHSCALTIGGRAFCWGEDQYGQLGRIAVNCPGEIAFNLCILAPTPVEGGLRFTRLATGLVITCGITPSQRLYCWGDIPGGLDSLGGTLRFTDVVVEGVVICALATNGQTYCWGDNGFGRLGIPLATPPQTLDDPQPVAGGHAFTSVRVRDDGACGTTSSGSLYCWGIFADTARFDGAGVVPEECWISPHRSFPCTHIPLRWRGAEEWARPATGPLCGITTAGAARCWGGIIQSWGSAVFGRSEPADVLAAAPEAQSILLPTPVRDIVGVGIGGCAHATDGRVLCWGTTNRGTFGTGAQTQTLSIPTVVAGGRAFTQLSVGLSFMCGLTADGNVWCWGDGQFGALGTGEVIPKDANGIRAVATPTRIASIAGK